MRSAWVFGAAAALAWGAGCDDDPSATAADPSTATTGEAPLVTDQYGSIAPTAAARERMQELATIPEGYEDCGSVAADSGWPTTILPSPQLGECLRMAYLDGRRAAATVTGRDQQGGTRVALFAVEEAGVLRVTRHRIDPHGDALASDVTCAPTAELWFLYDDGSVVDEGQAYCLE